jgi:hypothetical protein
MAATSQVPTVIGYLVDTFTAAATLGTATPAVAVRCGPALSGDFSLLSLSIGVEDPATVENGDTVNGASSDQTWVGMGARTRDEDLVVFCVAEAWTGDSGDTRAAMVAVYGILAAVENLLGADTYLGGLSLFQNPGSTGHTLKWRQGQGGLAAFVPFRIAVKSRLGGP